MKTRQPIQLVMKNLLALLVGLILFIGLPLLGWGIGQLPGFFHHPARVGYMVIIFMLQVFSALYNPGVSRKNKTSKRPGTKLKIDLMLIQIFSMAIVFLAPFLDQRSILSLHINNIIRYSGLILIIIGFLLMQIAEKFLNKQFSVEIMLQEHHELIQSGLYTYIRHPRYLGIFIFFSGISLIFNSLLGIILVIGLSCVLVWRMFAEEALMQQEFGEDWKAYCKKSWRIIPFVF